nr:ABC transporter ATP-binding protein [Pseudohoeflea sp. DP4N28-3]
MRVRFRQNGSSARAVDGVSFAVRPGETLAVVGESGSGKSVTMLSVMGLLDRQTAEVTGDVHYFDGNGQTRNLRRMPRRELDRIRGREIAMIFQDATASLNPLIRVGEQIAETIRLHAGADRQEAWRRTVQLLEDVGIAAAEQRARSYPHELSGGMRQRVMIAIALAGEPRLLIADEPTTALDVTIQTQILNLLEQLKRDRDLSILIVTHDLGVVAEVADRVVVMYAGEIVESGAAGDLLQRPRHPYTAALLACLPQIDWDAAAQTAAYERAKPGTVPTIDETFTGCRFRARCAMARATCERDVPMFETGPGWTSRCFFWEEMA